MPADQQDQMAPCTRTSHRACLRFLRDTSSSSEWHVCRSLPVIRVIFFLPLTLLKALDPVLAFVASPEMRAHFVVQKVLG